MESETADSKGPTLWHLEVDGQELENTHPRRDWDGFFFFPSSFTFFIKLMNALVTAGS